MDAQSKAKASDYINLDEVKGFDFAFVGYRTLIEVLGVTQKEITDLVHEGVFERYGQNMYPFKRCVTAYVRKQNREHKARGNKAELDDKKRLTKMQADLKELELAERAAVVVPVAMVIEQQAALVANFRQRMLSISHRAAPLAVVCDEIHEVSDILDGLIAEALGELTPVEVKAPVLGDADPEILAELPKRRGRPKGQKDAKPRTRRKTTAEPVAADV